MNIDQVAQHQGLEQATVLGRFLGLVTEDIRVIKAAAEAIEKNTPYYPWKHIFSSVLGVEVGAKVLPVRCLFLISLSC